MAVEMSRHLGTHNQNTYTPKHVMARGNSVWFAPTGSTYLTMPNSKGIINPSTKDIIYTVAPPAKPGTSNPRSYGKRFVSPALTTTCQFY